MMAEYCCKFKCSSEDKCSDFDYNNGCSEVQCEFQYDCEFCAFQNECDRESEELDAEVLPEKVCANCGMTIEGNYFKVGDNFLQVKYFDDEDTENLFCSKDCLCKALSVLEVDEEGEAFQL